jgi:hypothetical protein
MGLFGSAFLLPFFGLSLWGVSADCDFNVLSFVGAPFEGAAFEEGLGAAPARGFVGESVSVGGFFSTGFSGGLFLSFGMGIVSFNKAEGIGKVIGLPFGEPSQELPPLRGIKSTHRILSSKLRSLP